MLIESAQPGNWSATTTWVGGVIPANTNDVKINTGHDVIFDVNQSGFATGINLLTINGNLIHSHTTKNYLKVAGNITGTGKWWIGTPEHPIMRPVSGDTVFCNIMFGASNTYSIQHEIHGEVPNIVHSFLAEDSALGSNQLKTTTDLDLRANDKIAVGSKEVSATLTETAKGIYTVQSYDSVTKIITLTANLQTKRYANDLIVSLTRPINIDRVSGSTNYHSGTPLTNLILKGVSIGANGGYWLYMNSSHTNIDNFSSSNIYCEGVSSYARAIVYYGHNVVFNKCVMGGANYCLGAALSGDSSIENSYGVNGSLSYSNSGRVIIKNCISENCIVTRGYLQKNCSFKGMGLLSTESAQSIWDNCIFDGSGEGNGVAGANNVMYENGIFKNCIFKPNITGYMRRLSAKLYNCLFEADNNVWHSENNKIFRANHIIESFNHNQIENNNKWWLKGGKIETIQENGVYNPTKLKFTCESSDYSVFRDYPILIPANRDVKFSISLVKDTVNIVSKLQIIEPQSDPLIDSSLVPLVESTAQNNTIKQDLGINYGTEVPRQLILRVFCQGQGNVTVDTSAIDNIMAHPVNY